jgi:ectoine hydroxylase-related dioxygenase (phytanoyl-CoA dioxygenase family)
MTTAPLEQDLHAPYELSADQIDHFRERGFVKLRDVLSPEVIDHYGEAITKKVIELNEQTKPMAERNTYERAFLQIMNLWRHDERVKQFVFSRRLARIAAELLGTEGVRMYHDQALYKEPSGGHTPWHADQFYWPLATAKTCTVWAPLQATPLEMGPLEFAAKSFGFEFGRDLEISDESEAKLDQALKDKGFEHVVEPFDLGEVSFHYGWTFHRAGPNKTDQPRRVMTVIYMDRDMRLKQPENQNQVNDWETWCPGAKVGQIIDTPLNPVLWER